MENKQQRSRTTQYRIRKSIRNANTQLKLSGKESEYIAISHEDLKTLLTYANDLKKKNGFRMTTPKDQETALAKRRHAALGNMKTLLHLDDPKQVWTTVNRGDLEVLLEYVKSLEAHNSLANLETGEIEAAM